MGYRYTENEIKIAEWMGYKWNPCKHDMYCDPYWMLDSKATPTGGIPHFETDNGDAVSLLPELVKRGYGVVLEDIVAPDGWSVGIHKEGMELFTYHGGSISQAIARAVVGLIESIWRNQP